MAPRSLSAWVSSPRRRLRGILWPLPAEVINRNTPAALAALLVPLVFIVWKYNLRKPSASEKEWQNEEFERKRAKLATVIEQARGFLAAIEQERLKLQESADTGDANEAEKETPTSSMDKLLLKLIGGGKHKEEEFKIRFVDMWQSVRELQALCRTHELLPQGLDVAGQILSMELSHASLRTLDGRDRRFANGEKLRERLQLAKWFRQTCQRMRGDFGREHRGMIDRHLSDLIMKYVAGYAILGKQKKLDFFHALQLVFTAKKELFVLFIASFLSAVSGLFDALQVLYMTEAFEVLRDPAFQWPTFRQKLRASYSVHFLKMGMQMLVDRVTAMGRQRMAHRLRTQLYSSLLHQDFEWYRLGQTDQRNMQQIFGSVFKLPQHVTACTRAFTVMIEKCASTAGQVSIVLSKSSGLFKAMVLLEFVSALAHKGLHWLLEYFKWDIERRQVIVDVEWHEPLSPDNLPTTRAFTAEERTLTNWEMFWGSNMRKDSLKQVVDVLGAPFWSIVGSITQLGSSIRTAQLIKRGEVVMSDFEAIRAMTSNIVSHGRSLVETWTAAKENYEPLARSWEIISVKPLIGLEGGLKPPDRARGALVLEDVEFKYEEGPQVIKKVSFQIPAGTKCALTGATGSGKTTIFKLFERFHDPQKGQILLDGRDIKELNPVWLRQQMSIVDQRPRILSLPLRDNLIYGCKQDPSLEQIEDACRAAGIYDFVFHNKEKFPAGLYTRVSAHTLSGGELQRVAIARALLKDAPILLLDEATSALDSHTQTAVKSAIAQLMQGRTTVMIAHRLETIREADQIVVLSKGEVVEQGGHEALVAAGGHYAELYAQQVTETLVGEHQQRWK